MSSVAMSHRLGDLTDWFSGGTPSKKKPEYWGEDIPWISASSMGGSRYFDSDLKITTEGLEAGSRLAPKGSILLLVRGSTLHKRIPVGIAEREVAFNQDVKAIRVKPELIAGQVTDELYLYYWLKANEQLLLEMVEHTGIGAGKLDTKRLQNLEIELPPWHEQRKIVTTATTLDEKEILNSHINQTLEQMAQAIFKSWFVDFEPVKAKIAALEAGGSEEDALLAAMQAISGKSEAELTRLQAERPEQYAELRATAELFPSAMQDSELGEIPEGWTIAPFLSIARLDTTSVKPAQDPEKAWEHYSIPAFDEGATPAFETGADIKSNKYKVYPTAVLSSKLNPHFPRTWIPDVQNPDAAICSTEFMQFVPLEPQHRAFIAGMITSEPFQSGIMIRVTGSTGSRQRAQPKQVAAMDVILPKSELRAVYSQHTEAMYRMQSKNIWQAQSLASLRDTLLPKLLSGELSVSDAEYQMTEEELIPQEEIN